MQAAEASHTIKGQERRHPLYSLLLSLSFTLPDVRPDSAIFRLLRSC